MPTKTKIFNDPIYGFITIPYPFLLEIIEHPFFQRLRRIKQLGLTELVYPGALHTRFHHVLGATHLMTLAIESLRLKGVEITDEEAEGVCIAILLHDIGHGPYSHALEHSIVHNVNHEKISTLFMTRLNKEFDGKLDLAIQIFENRYPKKFLHEMVSSQLDMDRLDYLKRDSFYSGVSEGVVGNQRIISMLNVRNDRLCVEEKGIYSIEKFLVARRLMYWQVYLHKTVLSAEFMIVKLLQRAKYLAKNQKENLWSSPSMKLFLENEYGLDHFTNDASVLENFALLDDYDVLSCMKVWQSSTDFVLSKISSSVVNRNLWKVEIQPQEFDSSYKKKIIEEICKEFNVDYKEASYFLIDEKISNKAYLKNPDGNIPILRKDGKILGMSEAADNLNISALSDPVTKYFICYPKAILNRLAHL